MDERISIRAHYERFPATIKGAFRRLNIGDDDLIDLAGENSLPKEASR